MSSTSLARLRQQACERQGGRCYYCKLPLYTGNPRIRSPRGLLKNLQCTAEHLTPRQDGGRDTADNIAAACRYCNFGRRKRREDRVLPPAGFASYVEKRMSLGRWHPAIANAAGQKLIALLAQDFRPGSA